MSTNPRDMMASFLGRMNAAFSDFSLRLNRHDNKPVTIGIINAELLGLWPITHLSFRKEVIWNASKAQLKLIVKAISKTECQTALEVVDLSALDFSEVRCLKFNGFFFGCFF